MYETMNISPEFGNNTDKYWCGISLHTPTTDVLNLNCARINVYLLFIAVIILLYTTTYRRKESKDSLEFTRNFLF